MEQRMNLKQIITRTTSASAAFRGIIEFQGKSELCDKLDALSDCMSISKKPCNSATVRALKLAIENLEREDIGEFIAALADNLPSSYTLNAVTVIDAIYRVSQRRKLAVSIPVFERSEKVTEASEA